MDRGALVRQRRRQDIDRLQRAARASGVLLTFNAAVDLVREYGPEAINIVRNQARNPRDVSRLERLIGPGDRSESSTNNKKPRVDPPNTMMNVDGDPTVGGYRQISFSKKVLRGKRKRSVLSRVIQDAKEQEQDVIYRWQTLLTPLPTTATLLTKVLSNYSTGTSLYTGCYCFNLSAPGQTGDGSYTAPCYRLYKDAAALTAARAWKWDVQGGIKNDPLGVATSALWQLEHSEQNSVVNAQYRHDWSDIRLMLQGTTNYPIRVHVYVVQFKVDGLGPIRKYGAGAATDADINPTDPQEISEADYFWERFMMPKMTHPFANTKKTGLQDRRHLAVLSHDVVMLNNELNISADAQPLQHIKRMFVRNGTVYTTINTKDVEASLMPSAGRSGLTNAAPPGFANQAGNDMGDTFPLREYDRWLMIVPEHYIYTSDVVPQTTGNSPSFDICVRSKYTLFTKP